MMYCHACGIALSQPTKYCNRCGVQLINQDPTGEVKRTEKRLDEYLDGLFWITVFGEGLIFGGMVVMKRVGLSDFFIFRGRSEGDSILHGGRTLTASARAEASNLIRSNPANIFFKSSSRTGSLTKSWELLPNGSILKSSHKR